MPFLTLPQHQQATKRLAYVSTKDAQKVLKACPDTQWRLIFALARWGGLRVPSEPLALRWVDVNWEQQRIRVHSPKTEHHEGHESRLVPIFPEIMPHLQQAFDEAEPGNEHIIIMRRSASTNLRTGLHRIIIKAGLIPWPRLFHNLRSTRQTELEHHFPTHVVCAWLGNNSTTANKHYLQITENDFSKAVQNPVHFMTSTQICKQLSMLGLHSHRLLRLAS